MGQWMKLNFALNRQLSNLLYFSSRTAEIAIAGEVAAHLCSLIRLCSYVGWNGVAQQLALAKTELDAIVNKEHPIPTHGHPTGNAQGEQPTSAEIILLKSRKPS
jgi:hypothetical protein